MPDPLYEFDRFLRFDDMTAWLHDMARAHPRLLSVDSYGKSHEGRDLWLATITDAATGPHHTKPAHWVDANIHAVEVTGGVAALFLIQYLLDGFDAGDTTVTGALRTRVFYVVPRVNPDGVEAALADRPRFYRSSVRPWPWHDAHRWPGLHPADLDGDGRILTMRIPDVDGAWVPHPDEARVMVPVGPLGVAAGVTRYRLLTEGTLEQFDGFTVPMPGDPSGLDLNRNFPAGWDTGVTGSGDHPLSEPETDALVRAIRARPNICGYNAFHTAGGVLLRPSSTKSDASIPPVDLWVWKQFGEVGTRLTNYKAHSVFEDFTWDKASTMSGAADDWAYEHLGVIAWTTEFWDAIHAATGEHSPTDIWYVGPTPEQDLAVCKWSDQHAPGSYVPWHPFEHPQLGPVEIGGPDFFRIWSNAPGALLRAEVAPHAQFAVFQALASPLLEIKLCTAEALGDHTWRIKVGLANTGWLNTDVSQWARKQSLVLPVTLELAGATPIVGDTRVKLGQLAGRSAVRINGGAMSDGTPDRVLHTWVVRGKKGDTVTLTARHQRAGEATASVTLP